MINGHITLAYHLAIVLLVVMHINNKESNPLSNNIG